MFRSLSLSLAAVCAAGLFSAPSAQAQSKVAVINLRRAILDTAEFKKAVNELTARYKPRQDSLEKAQRELQDIQQLLQSSQGKISQQETDDLTARGQRKQREVQRLTEDLQADGEREQNDLVTKATEKMNVVVKKIADEKGLDLVVDISNTVYFKPALEITDEAITAYDKAHPVAAAPAAPAPPKK